MLDQFFTPADACAAAYRSWGTTKEGLRIGDFACGNGSLLELAPFTSKVLFGLDVDPLVVDELRIKHPDWHLQKGDFLRPTAPAKRFLNKLIGTLDLVVLNPPFSCRGGSRESIDYEGERVTCSKAMAFVVKSLQFVNKSGSAMAILPKSILRSEKDAEALRMIKRDWQIDVKEEFPRSTFSGCNPRSVCVTLHRRPNRLDLVSSRRTSAVSTARQLRIVRGCLPVYKTSDLGPIPVLHTTELTKEAPLSAIKRFAQKESRPVSGTIVTIPRVGCPDQSKIRLLRGVQGVSLSDCIIALLPVDITEAPALLRDLLWNWEALEALYGSTCAPYITLAELTDHLRTIGWVVLDGSSAITTKHALATP